MNKLKAHVFICTNKRAEGEASCGARGSEALRAEVKEKARALYGKDVRINASGCLGPCERGIACVIYPQNEWHLELTANDGETLLEQIKTVLQS